MKDLALDTTGDLLIVDFDAALVDGVDQIAQNLAIRLRFMQGEWFLDNTAGVPYYQYFFIKNPNQIQIESILKNEILNTSGVINLTSFNSDFDGQTRKFTVNFACKALDQTLQMELDLP